MNDIAKKIKLIAATGLHPLLKQAGFRKNGTHFSRIEQEALQVINVQSSQWNNASSGKFTLNIGVHFAVLAKMLHGKDPMPAVPKEYYCLIRRRVGTLLPAGNDHWWVVIPETDAEAVAAEVESAWKDYVSPWLEKMRTIAGAAVDLETAGGVEFWTAAAARIALGQPERAARSVERMIELLRSDRAAAHPANAARTAENIKKLQDWAVESGLSEFINT